MATQQQRSENTRLKLMKAFKASFLKRGFDGTTTQQILKETGLSKGALYHHFQSKNEIIEAIYEEESRGAIERALRSVDGAASPLARLRKACMAWTKEVRSPNVSKILFEIGPAALGRQKAKEIEDTNSLIHIETLLKDAIEADEIALADPKLTAALINALMAEATLYTLRTRKDSAKTLEETLNALIRPARTKKSMTT